MRLRLFVVGVELRLRLSWSLDWDDVVLRLSWIWTLVELELSWVDLLKTKNFHFCFLFSIFGLFLSIFGVWAGSENFFWSLLIWTDIRFTVFCFFDFLVFFHFLWFLQFWHQIWSLFLLFWALMGYFWGLSSVRQLFWVLLM